MKPAGVPTVFIIDDDRGMRQAVQDLVESVGLRAESFATGEEFLEKPRRFPRLVSIGNCTSIFITRPMSPSRPQ